MSNPSSPSELKKIWQESSIGEIALFFGVIILVGAIANAFGIWAAQKMS